METTVSMKNYYVCRNFNDNCGISKYGLTFHSSILKKKGYEIIHLENEDQITNLLKTITNDDHIWFEIGLGSTLESMLFKKIIKKGNKNVTVTVHDAPFIDFPLFKTRYNFLNNVMKIMQLIFLRKPLTNYFYRYFKNAKIIYTLNPKGKKMMIDRYGLKNIKSIMHILTEILSPEIKVYGQPQILFFGFVGKNKGLDYALELHSKLNTNIHMKVIGKAIDNSSIDYFNKLKKIYNKNVEYLGYLEDVELIELMKKDNIVFLPTREYKYICPTSGSVLNSLKYLNIVFTNNVNSNSFIIDEGVNGFYFTNQIDKDLEKVKMLIDDELYRKEIAMNIYKYLQGGYSSDFVEKEIA